MNCPTSTRFDIALALISPLQPKRIHSTICFNIRVTILQSPSSFDLQFINLLQHNGYPSSTCFYVKRPLISLLQRKRYPSSSASTYQWPLISLLKHNTYPSSICFNIKLVPHQPTRKLARPPINLLQHKTDRSSTCFNIHIAPTDRNFGLEKREIAFWDCYNTAEDRCSKKVRSWTTRMAEHGYTTDLQL